MAAKPLSAQISPGNYIKIGALGISSITYSRDNKMMAVASLKRVDVLVTGGNSVNNSIHCKVDEINDIAFSGDDSKIIVAGKKKFGNAVQIYDAKMGNLVFSIPVSGNLLSVDVSRGYFF
jgi:WD40 repeat protein